MNQTDKSNLAKWAKENECAYSFTEPSYSVNSYFSAFDNTDNLCSYGFDTVQELSARLTELWRGKDWLKKRAMMIAVIAFKNQPSEDTALTDKDLYAISDFVYMF